MYPDKSEEISSPGAEPGYQSSVPEDLSKEIQDRDDQVVVCTDSFFLHLRPSDARMKLSPEYMKADNLDTGRSRIQTGKLDLDMVTNIGKQLVDSPYQVLHRTYNTFHNFATTFG